MFITEFLNVQVILNNQNQGDGIKYIPVKNSIEVLSTSEIISLVALKQQKSKLNKKSKNNFNRFVLNYY